MIGSSMRLWQILFFSLCLTTTLFYKCHSFKLVKDEDDSGSIGKNDGISRISIEHGDFKRDLGGVPLTSNCEIGDNVGFDCWNKKCPTLKEKDQSFTIKFKTHFSSAPKVIVGLDALDVNHKFNTRVRATANEVTAKQFRLNIKAWADTVLYWANAHWIACGPTGPACDA